MINKTLDSSGKNLFGFLLNQLLHSTKKLVPRRVLSVVIGVSEPGISQWIRGKTFPEPHKLRTLISIFKKEKLNEYQHKKMADFMALLELKPNDVTNKKLEDDENYSVSSYLLKDVHAELEKTISVLFYEMKIELYTQFSRQINIIQKDLHSALLKDFKDSDSAYEKVKKTKALKAKFSDSKNYLFFSSYTEKVKDIHSRMNDFLENMLKEDFEDSNRNVHLIINKIPAPKDVRITEDPDKIIMHNKSLNRFPLAKNKDGLYFKKKSFNPIGRNQDIILIKSPEIQTYLNRFLSKHIRINEEPNYYCHMGFAKSNSAKRELLNIYMYKKNKKRFDDSFLADNDFCYAFDHISPYAEKSNYCFRKLDSNGIKGYFNREDNLKIKLAFLLKRTGSSFAATNKKTSRIIFSKKGNSITNKQADEYIDLSSFNELLKTEDAGFDGDLGVFSILKGEKLDWNLSEDCLLFVLSGQVNIADTDETKRLNDILQSTHDNNILDNSKAAFLKGSNNYHIKSDADVSVVLRVEKCTESQEEIK